MALIRHENNILYHGTEFHVRSSDGTVSVNEFLPNRFDLSIASTVEAVHELEDDVEDLQTELSAHTSDTANPHNVTASQVGADPEGTAESLVSLHNVSNDAHSDIRQLMTNEATTRENADTDLSGRIDAEVSERQDGDINLQSQIDSITSKSDVVDVVGTHAELMAYDTSMLGDNDVIKVLEDETQDDAESYYRWNATTETWGYIGSQGPFVTPAEMQTALNEKVDKVSGKGLSTNDFTDSAKAITDNIFLVTYNSTSYADIKAAYDAGKTILCRFTDSTHTLRVATFDRLVNSTTSTSYAYFSTVSKTDAYELVASKTRYGSTTTWTNTHKTWGALAEKDNVTNADISGTIQDAHIASASTWNGKQDAIDDLSTIRTNASNGQTAYGWGDHATWTPSFSQATSRANLNGSGETISTIFGKIKKWFADLKTVAFTGSYNDLTNKPTIPPAITVDSAMSSSSTNPVQNKVVNSALGGKAPTSHASTATTYGVGDATNYGHVKVDSAMSSSSTNPVQNKVIKSVTDALSTRIDNIPSYGGFPVVEIVIGNTLPSNPQNYIYKKTTGGITELFTFIKVDETHDSGRIYLQKLYSDVANLDGNGVHVLYIEYNKSTRTITNFVLSTVERFMYREILYITKDWSGGSINFDELDEVKRAYENHIPCILHAKIRPIDSPDVIERDFNLGFYIQMNDVESPVFSACMPDQYANLVMYVLYLDEDGIPICYKSSLLDTSVLPIPTQLIADSAVTTDKIDNYAVTGIKIANSAVTNDKMANEAVTRSKIAQGAVSTDKQSCAAFFWTVSSHYNGGQRDFMELIGPYGATGSDGSDVNSFNSMLAANVNTVRYSDVMVFFDVTYSSSSDKAYAYCNMQSLPKFTLFRVKTSCKGNGLKIRFRTNSSTEALSQITVNNNRATNTSHDYTLDPNGKEDICFFRGEDSGGKCSLYLTSTWTT